jgi:hypothetical protein
MSSPSNSALSPVAWSILQTSVGGVTFPIARLEVPLYLGVTPPSPRSPRHLCWLDTGAPLSVIPFHVHHQSLNWKPIPGIKTTWSGQVCDLGSIDVWLATTESPHLRGPFSLLAKFPRSDPPGSLVPVLLGLEFFLSHGAEFQLPLPPRDGSILLP